MTIYYVVPSPPGQTVSGGTRKLFDHVAILNDNGIEAGALHVVPPHKIDPGVGNLFIFPEVYGRYLVEALPPGVPRISMVQNGYLLDHDGIAPPGDPHPFMCCPDLVAVMVESQHTEDLVRERFPELPCPIIRFTSSGNGRDGRSAGLHYGQWPREKVVTYFEYKRQELNREIFGDLKLPPEWSIRPMSNLTDAQVAETLRRAAIFAAPLTHEGLCATTQEAMIAGAAIVAWPGGPSRFVPSGWPVTSTPVALTEGNTTVGGPMEYLHGRAEIAPQDDLEALRALIAATARSIDADPEHWALRAAETSRWHCEVAYSREQEIDEIVGIMRDLLATDVERRHGSPIAPARRVDTIDIGIIATSLAANGRHGAAADLLLEALRHPGAGDQHLALLVDALAAERRGLSEISEVVPGAKVGQLLPELVKIDATSADEILDALHAKDQQSLPILAAAAEIGTRLPIARQLAWSARLRARGLGASCPATLAAVDEARPAVERLIGAAAVWATFADPIARQVFVATALSLPVAQRDEIAPAIGSVAPDLAAIVRALPAPTERQPAAATIGARVLVLSQHSAGIRGTALAAAIATHGARVTLLQPEPASSSRTLLAGFGVKVASFPGDRSLPAACLELLLREQADIFDCIVIPATARRLLAPIRSLLPSTAIVVDAEEASSTGISADLVISSRPLRGAVEVAASASQYLSQPAPLPEGVRAGICIVGDLRDAPPAATEALSEIAAAVTAAAPGAPIVVLGDDPDGLLGRPGWLQVGPVADPTPWLRTAQLVLALPRGGAHWQEAARLSSTACLVISDDRSEIASLASRIATLLKAGKHTPSAVADRQGGGLGDELTSLIDARRPQQAPVAGERHFVLADADEVLNDERLLATYGAAFSTTDPVTLVVYGPGADPVAFENRLRIAARGASFDLENGPTVIALLPPTAIAAEEEALATKIAAVLSDRTPARAFARIERVSVGTPAELRRLFGAEPGWPARRAATPLVSVLVPVYNHDRHLRDCVESVLTQTCGDIEVLLIDDCSTDEATEIAADLEASDPRVRLVRNAHNLGLVANHRRCLEEASGEFVKFVHADDRLRPNALERLVAAALLHPEATLVTSARNVIDRYGRAQPPVSWTIPLRERDEVLGGISVGNYLLSTGWNAVGEPSTVLFRRSAMAPADFSAFAGRNYTSLLDISTWIRLLSDGHLAWIAEPLSELRLHADQYGNALGTVVQHMEWTTLITDARARGFLADDKVFTTALGTMTLRLLNAYVQDTQLDPEEVSAAVGSAIMHIARRPRALAVAS